MAWDKDLPIDNEKLRTLAGVIRANWLEIEQNDTAVKANALNQWVIHLIDRTDASVTGPNSPARIDDVGMLYCRSDGEGAKNNLFFQDSENPANDIQLTRNDKVTDAANGMTFLPGGLVMQWFKETGIAKGVTSITFPTAFDSEIYNIQATVVAGAATDVSSTMYIVDGTETVTGFDVRNRSTPNIDIYFVAIGK